MFRTATGQTGLDAYLFEAAAIANAQRELDARMGRLMDAITEENPDGLHGTRISTSWDGRTSRAHAHDIVAAHEHYRRARWADALTTVLRTVNR